MDSFTLSLAPSAVRDLDRLEKKRASQIIDKLSTLEEDPFPRGTLIKKLKGRKNVFYRLRVGGYRVFYFIEGGKIIILRVIDKKDAEKYIKTV